jgi:hypothetical protein
MTYRTRLILVLMLLVLTFAGGIVIASRQANDQQNSDKGSGGHRNGPSQLAPIALSIIAKRNGSTVAELQVTASTTLDLPLSGKVAHQFSVRNRRSGTVYEVVLDPGGNELDREQLLRDEKAVYVSKYGKLDSALAERLDGADDSELLPVQIRVIEADDDDSLPRQVPMTSEGWKKMSDREKKAYEDQEEETVQQRRKLLTARAQRLVEPVVKKLMDANYQCQTEDSVPVVNVRLTKRMIKEVETWPEVERISLVGTSRPSLDVSRSTIGADIVEGRGVPNLRSIQTAIVEVGGNVAGNPYLTNTTQNFSNICQSVSDHATFVAGVIESSHNLVRGIDPTAGVWAGGSCSGSDSELQDAVLNAITFGAKAVNCSFNNATGTRSLTTFDQFMDRMVRNNRATIVVSIGNNGAPCSGDGLIRTPAKAYNVLSVGAFDDHNTTTWGDDSIWPCVPNIGPNSVNGDREKPEVVAPGVLIRSTLTNSPWVDLSFFSGNTGTSLSAPHVTGEVALMMAREKVLKFKPEVIKAIVMASAGHGISPFDKSLQGSGAISASWADDVVAGTLGTWGESTYDCLSPSPFFVTNVPLLGGVLTRVAIAWSTKDNYSNYFAQPSADVNLVLLDPSGNSVSPFHGNSYDNTFEWIEFVPASTNVYTLKIEKRRCDVLPNGIVAYAWWQSH